MSRYFAVFYCGECLRKFRSYPPGFPLICERCDGVDGGDKQQQER